jgi:hypothetical protein
MILLNWFPCGPESRYAIAQSTFRSEHENEMQGKSSADELIKDCKADREPGRLKDPAVRLAHLCSGPTVLQTS